MSKDAWGYVRISQESDASIEEQKRSIREYAREHDLNLQTTRNDGTRTSGFDSDRDEYQLIREKIRNSEIDALITRDRARLARDFDERLTAIVDFRTTNIEWHVVEAGGRLELEDVQTAGMECLHAMMDHFKKMVEIERSRKVVRERIENGYYQGAPPTGLQFADDGKHLEKDEMWDELRAAWRFLDESQAEAVRQTELSEYQVKQLSDRGLEWYVEKYETYSKNES